eukprot:4037598-Pleurochrysis_carterae.AAC.1
MSALRPGWSAWLRPRPRAALPPRPVARRRAATSRRHAPPAQRRCVGSPPLPQRQHSRQGAHIIDNHLFSWDASRAA